MLVGYVQIPVGITGSLLLDGREYSFPMAMTEGCLVASTNRGCKAIHLSDGAFSVLIKDAMTKNIYINYKNLQHIYYIKESTKLHKVKNIIS